MDKILLYNNLLGDIGNLLLVIFGFSVTLFTVLYSFILSKRELLRDYSELLKKGTNDPLLVQKNANAVKFIEKLKSFNWHLIVVIFIDLIAYLISMTTKYLIQNESCKRIITIAIGITCFFIIGYVAVLLIITVRDYYKNTKL